MRALIKRSFSKVATCSISACLVTKQAKKFASINSWGKNSKTLFSHKMAAVVVAGLFDNFLNRFLMGTLNFILEYSASWVLNQFCYCTFAISPSFFYIGFEANFKMCFFQIEWQFYNCRSIYFVAILVLSHLEQHTTLAFSLLSVAVKNN